MLAFYAGHEPLTFPGWLDLGTGQTLSAVPGVTYDIAPASGNTAEDVPAPWFTPLESGSEDEAVPEDAEPEAEDPQPGQEEQQSEDGEQQQF